MTHLQICNRRCAEQASCRPHRSRAASIGTAAAAAPAGAPATAPFAPTVDGLAELARKVESERLAIYRAQIGVDGPRALDGKSYSELSLGVI